MHAGACCIYLVDSCNCTANAFLVLPLPVALAPNRYSRSDHVQPRFELSSGALRHCHSDRLLRSGLRCKARFVRLTQSSTNGACQKKIALSFQHASARLPFTLPRSVVIDQGSSIVRPPLIQPSGTATGAADGLPAPLGRMKSQHQRHKLSLLPSLVSVSKRPCTELKFIWALLLHPHCSLH